MIPIPRGAEGLAAEARAREAGEDLLREGRVALVLLAGGQGTRLGFDGPKGDFPFAPITGRTLFAHHAAKVAALRARYGSAAALVRHDLARRTTPPPARASPARGTSGSTPRRWSSSSRARCPPSTARRARSCWRRRIGSRSPPTATAGCWPPCRRAGLVERMRAEGLTTIYTFQVDNPLVRVARPALLGYHALAGAEMSSVVVRKVGPAERMGVVARVGGRTALVEYSDLPDVLAERREPDGELTFWAGSIAVHCLAVDLVERLTAGGGAGLPHHRADKRVAHLDAAGALVEPEAPNAVKFETFLFDALPLAERTVTVEAAREDEFSPIKNARGDDSPATARRDLNRLYARWLEAAGVAVPRDAAGEPRYDLEVDPRLALDADELRARLPAGLTEVAGPLALEPSTGP